MFFKQTVISVDTHNQGSYKKHEMKIKNILRRIMHFFKNITNKLFHEICTSLMITNQKWTLFSLQQQITQTICFQLQKNIITVKEWQGTWMK